jgi:hypothetical protein
VNYEASLQTQQKDRVGVNAFYENRKEEETIPALEFNGFVVTKGLTISLPPRAGWIATTYSVRVKKIKGIGKAKECEGFVSITDSPLSNMRSRWLPDNVPLCDIGSYMDLIMFQTIPIREEIVFSPVSLEREMAILPFPLGLHVDELLNIEVHAKNTKSPRRILILIFHYMTYNNCSIYCAY